MVYLDYSASTKICKEAIDTYVKVSTSFYANPNSMHTLGLKSKKLIDESLKKIAFNLGVKPSEIIFTSGASESNNTALKGVCFKYKNRKNHIISTKLEHSSVLETLNFLEKEGFNVDYVDIDDNGLVDLNHLKRLINDKTILVSINAVSSELGIKQPLEEISKIVKSYDCFFHSDVTQLVGKEKVDLNMLDLASLSSQKFYGPKSIGILYKKEKINLEPLIHGGKSTTSYRSGTPDPALIASMSKALTVATTSLEENINKVKSLNSYLLNKLKNLDIQINSNEYSIPHIVNISLKNINSETMLHALEQDEIFISTKTACSNGDYSEAVYSLTNNMERAKRSLRISISHLTTKEELDFFVDKLSYYIKTL